MGTERTSSWLGIKSLALSGDFSTYVQSRPSPQPPLTSTVRTELTFAALAPMAAMISGLVASFDIFEARHRIDYALASARKDVRDGDLSAYLK